MTASAAAPEVNVPALIDQQNISGLQIRVAALCAAVVFMDGFDAQAIGYVAPTLSKAWNLKPGELGFKGPRDQVWPELALRFTLSQPAVHCAIIGTTNPENARANIAAAEKGPLPAEVVRKIREAFRRAGPGRAWAGQT